MNLVPENINEAIKHLPGRSLSDKEMENYKLSKFRLSRDPEYQKIIKILNSSKDDLLLIRDGIMDDRNDITNLPFQENEKFDEDWGYNSYIDYLEEEFFEKLLDENETIKKIIVYEEGVTEKTPKDERYEIGDWYCYPKKQIAIWHDDRQYTYQGIIFHKKYFDAMIQSVNNYTGEE
jgi:hypothetical protein